MALLDQVGIVGVGLLGASIGLALKERRLCRVVVGNGPRIESLRVALERGAIDRIEPQIGSWLNEISLLVVCSPVDRVTSILASAAGFLSPTAWVTDVGSTKRSIVRQADAMEPTIPFVGSHPLAGSEKRGPQWGNARLFEGRVCIMTPTDRTREDVQAGVRGFWESVGMQVFECRPEEHDRIVSRTSHLPHVAASALAALLGPGDTPFAGPGIRDTTRVAAGDPNLWTAILLDNADDVSASLDAYQSQLHRFLAALRARDRHTLGELLRDGKHRRDALGS